MQRPVRVLGGPAVRAACGGCPNLTWLPLTVVLEDSGSHAKRLELLRNVELRVWYNSTLGGSVARIWTTYSFACPTLHYHQELRRT